MDADEELAKAFPQIDWIIGAHSSSFTYAPKEIGKTKLVQVLSKNHYLGEVSFAHRESKEADTFSLLEIHDQLASQLRPNPVATFLAGHKQRLKQVQLQEEAEQTVTTYKETRPGPDHCLSCHGPQYAKWQTTAHSLAYATLLQKNEETNPQCVGCHTWGYKKNQGA